MATGTQRGRSTPKTQDGTGKRVTMAVDFAASGLTIQSAMLAAERRGEIAKGPPRRILWAGRSVQTGDVLQVPRTGRLRLEILSASQAVRQGVDIKLKGGCVLADGSVVPHLQTWADERFNPVVEYDYSALDGKLATWNSYEVPIPGGVRVEQWTENAGMWIEELGPLDRRYHCSHGCGGSAVPPDFEALVYRLTIVTGSP